MKTTIRAMLRPLDLAEDLRTENAENLGKIPHEKSNLSVVAHICDPSILGG